MSSDKVTYECGSTGGGDLITPYCPMCGAPILSELSDEDTRMLQDLIVLASKELGEIADHILKGDPTFHWRDELGDLCGLAVKPMLELAHMRYADACKIGIARKKEETTK